MKIINEEFKNETKRHEGFREYLYWDSKQNLTWGWGHNITANWFPKDFLRKYSVRCITKPCTPSMAEWLLDYDIQRAFEQLEVIFNEELFLYPQNVIWALSDMMFNMGPKSFNGFKKMIRAIKNKDYKEAGLEIVDSNYYRECCYLETKLKGLGHTNTFNRAQINVVKMYSAI